MLPASRFGAGNRESGTDATPLGPALRTQAVVCLNGKDAMPRNVRTASCNDRVSEPISRVGSGRAVPEGGAGTRTTLSAGLTRTLVVAVSHSVLGTWQPTTTWACQGRGRRRLCTAIPMPHSW